MADECDVASQISMDHVERSIRKRALQALNAGASLRYCEDCADEIPDARRQAVNGCRRCTECQSFRDMQARQLCRE